MSETEFRPPLTAVEESSKDIGAVSVGWQVFSQGCNRLYLGYERGVTRVEIIAVHRYTSRVDLGDGLSVTIKECDLNVIACYCCETIAPTTVQPKCLVGSGCHGFGDKSWKGVIVMMENVVDG